MLNIYFGLTRLDWLYGEKKLVWSLKDLKQIGRTKQSNINKQAKLNFNVYIDIPRILHVQKAWISDFFVIK